MDDKHPIHVIMALCKITEQVRFEIESKMISGKVNLARAKEDKYSCITIEEYPR
jgi:hypothetical protein